MNPTLLQVQMSEFVNPASNVFIWQVYVPIMAWMLLIIILLALLMKKYTFGKWTKLNPNPYQAETLELPGGVFRALITLTLLYVVIVLELVNVWVTDFEFQMGQFMVAFQMMIAFYFGAKVVSSVTEADKSKSKNKTEVQVAMFNNSAAAGSVDNSNVDINSETTTTTTTTVTPNKDEEAAG